MLEERFKYFILRFKINVNLKKIGASKVKGVPASVLFPFLPGSVFTRKNL
jgi:hypothetical protein